MTPILAAYPWELDTARRRVEGLRMDRDEIIARIKSLEPAIRAEGVAHLAIFGSRARGTQNQDSDLDVLIDIDPGARFSLFNLSGVGLLIEGATGIHAQVVLKRSAEPAFMTRIASDLARIF